MTSIPGGKGTPPPLLALAVLGTVDDAAVTARTAILGCARGICCCCCCGGGDDLVDDDAD